MSGWLVCEEEIDCYHVRDCITSRGKRPSTSFYLEHIRPRKSSREYIHFRGKASAIGNYQLRILCCVTVSGRQEWYGEVEEVEAEMESTGKSRSEN